MPTNRIPLQRPVRYRITPAAIAAYQAGDDLALHRELGLKPFQPSPLEADGPAPSWGDGLPYYTYEWALARQLRLALEAAVAESETAAQGKGCRDDGVLRQELRSEQSTSLGEKLKDENRPRRTNADKRAAVKTLLADEVWRERSDRWIASEAGVDQKFVWKLRNELSTEDRPQLKDGSKPKRLGRDGKQRAAPKKKAAPAQGKSAP
jgi:hypothetical protein